MSSLIWSNYGSIRCLSPMFDVELIHELFEPSTVKLDAVVGDNHSRKTIPTYDGFLDKIFDLGSSDIGHRFGFYPFGEVVHRDEEKSLL